MKFARFLELSETLYKQPGPPPRPGLEWNPETHRWIKTYKTSMADYYKERFNFPTPPRQGDKPLSDKQMSRKLARIKARQEQLDAKIRRHKKESN